MAEGRAPRHIQNYAPLIQEVILSQRLTQGQGECVKPDTETSTAGVDQPFLAREALPKD